MAISIPVKVESTRLLTSCATLTPGYFLFAQTKKIKSPYRQRQHLTIFASRERHESPATQWQRSGRCGWRLDFADSLINFTFHGANQNQEEKSAFRKRAFGKTRVTLSTPRWLFVLNSAPNVWCRQVIFYIKILLSTF